MTSNTDDFWVFGYGSLMWWPGFPFRESEVGRVFGFHRALCTWSVVYRGTPEHPGLVLGLDRGGSCDGVAFRVAAGDRTAVLEYLHEREMPTNAYEPRTLPVHLRDGRRVSAYGFVARRDHAQYASGLSDAETAAIIRNAKGRNGAAVDYLVNTLTELDKLGIRDTALKRVGDLVVNGR